MVTQQIVNYSEGFIVRKGTTARWPSYLVIELP